MSATEKHNRCQHQTVWENYWIHRQLVRVALMTVCWSLPPVTDMWFSFSTGTPDTLGCMTLCIFRYCSLARRSSTLRSFSGTPAGFCASSLLPVRTKRWVTFHHATYYSPPPQPCPNMTQNQAYCYILAEFFKVIYDSRDILKKMHKRLRAVNNTKFSNSCAVYQINPIIYLYTYTGN